jgi:hypothetical protein
MTLTWVFIRDNERVELRREVDPTSVSLDVSGADGLRTFAFRDHAALVAFQAGFEQALAHSGWHLEGFQPERRSGHDRRAVPRITERRGSLELVWSRVADPARP